MSLWYGAKLVNGTTLPNTDYVSKNIWEESTEQHHDLRFEILNVKNSKPKFFVV